MESPQFDELKPGVVLGIAAHPDDLDFGAAGTMAKFAQEGAAVYYLILTDGSKGSDDYTMTGKMLTSIRKKEQRAATKVLGGKGVSFLDYPDSGLEITMKLKEDIVKEIRVIKPDVVITMDPSIIYSADRGFINHPDHRAAGQATLDAVFPLARDHMTFPKLFTEGFKPHKTKTILLVNFEKSNYYVDITKTFNKKISALKTHSSQIKDIENIKNWVQQMSENIGEKAGYELAESFVRIDIRG